MISQGQGPIAKTTNEDTSVSWNANELNATDADTQPPNLSWSLVGTPSNGTATVDGNGSSPANFSYSPNPNFSGSDSFLVQVSDGAVSDSILVNVTVTPVDDPAIISGDFNATIAEDAVATGDLNAEIGRAHV